MITDIERLQKWERQYARDRLQRMSVRQGLAVFDDLYRASMKHLGDSNSHLDHIVALQALVRRSIRHD